MGPLVASLLLIGCQQQSPSQALFAPLGQLLRLQPPIRLGVTRLHINPLVAPPWQPLQQDLQRVLARPVQVQQLKPFQVRTKLRLGQLDFALVSAFDYLQITSEPVCQILAAPLNPDGSLTRRALIIVARNSPIKALAELKGKRFAFGPRNDPILHLAVVDALVRAGVKPGDLGPEILPPFGFHINSYEAAKAILYEGAAAAAVDQREFATWPETNAPPFQLARDRFRVIAKTDPVPNGPFLAGSKTDPKIVATVRTYLLEKVRTRPEVLQALTAGGFAKVEPETYEALRAMQQRVRSAL